MKVLRKFIRETLQEHVPAGRDIPFNYWVRRPRNTLVKGLGDDIEDVRRSVFEPVADSFEEEVGHIKNSVWSAASVNSLLDRIARKGLDVEEIVVDITEFQTAVDNDDLPEVKRQVMQGLGKWSQEAIKGAEQSDYNISMLQGLGDLGDV